MFHLIGSILEFALHTVSFAFKMVFGALGLVINILGTVFSVLLGTGAVLLCAALIFVVRRGKKKSAEPEKEPTRVYDVDEEEFTSFYDQFRQ